MTKINFYDKKARRATFVALLLLFEGIESLSHNDYSLVAVLLVAGWLLMTLYRRIVQSVEGGRLVATAMYSLLASPGLLLFFAVYGENRRLVDVLNISTLPLTVLLGETLALPTAFVAAAWARRIQRANTLATDTTPPTGSATTYQAAWRWVALAAGLGVGLALHAWSGGAHYLPHDVASSITKDYLDLVALPALFGAALYVMPSMFRLHNRYTAWYLGPLLVWLVLASIDMSTRGLDPHGFHAACSTACGAHNLSVHLHNGLEAVRSFLRSIHAAQ